MSTCEVWASQQWRTEVRRYEGKGKSKRITAEKQRTRRKATANSKGTAAAESRRDACLPAGRPALRQRRKSGEWGVVEFFGTARLLARHFSASLPNGVQRGMLFCNQANSEICNSGKSA